MAKLTVTESDLNLRSRITSDLKANLGITHNGLDSTANVFSEILANEITNQRQSIVNAFDNMQITNATGSNLDALAFERYAVARKSSSKSKSNSFERNVFFYVSDSTFGNYNNNQNIIIPQGTLLSSSYNFSNSDIIYEVTEETVLLADETFGYVSVEAINAGFNYNVSENSLIFHNFEGYTDSYTNALQVTNRYPILNGNDTESDDDFKFRLTNFMTAAVNKNNDMLTLAALQAPGVLEVKVIPSFHGIGTTGVILFNSGRRSSDEVELDAASFLLELNSPGSNVILSKGINVFLDFDLRVYIRPTLNTNEREILKDNLTQEIYRLVKDNEYSGFIDFSLISSYVIQNRNYNSITGYGSDSNNRNIFENVFLRRTDRYNEFPEERERVISNSFSLEPYERVLLGSVNIFLEEDNRS